MLIFFFTEFSYLNIFRRKKLVAEMQRAENSGGELGIRTPDGLGAHTRLAGEHLRPLGQLSKMGA